MSGPALVVFDLVGTTVLADDAVPRAFAAAPTEAPINPTPTMASVSTCISDLSTDRGKDS